NSRGLEEMTLASNLRLWRSWANRCFGNNRRFMRLRYPGISGHLICELALDQLEPLLADPESPFREAAVPLLKNSRSSAVALLDFTCRVGGAQRDPSARSGEFRRAPPTLSNQVIYKCFRAGSLWDSLANLFRRSPCRRSWQNAHAFLDCLLP